MEGADLVLKAAKDAGLIITLVTGSGQKSLLERLNKAYPDYFVKERMVTSDDVQYGKPHPEPYLMGLQKSGVSAEEAIVVENAPLGIASAVAAGIYTIAVNTGPLAEQVLKDAGAAHVFPSMKAFAADFNEIVGRKP